MNKFAALIYLTLVMVSCGTNSDQFKIEGRFRHINQGEFYIYSLSDQINGVDTIKVQDGQFAFEMPCTEPTTLVIMFPNFSEQPIFAEPGEAVTLSGDVSLLREMKVKGTKDNELMNDFRQQIVSASPPETIKYATQFIKDHPESVVSAYLLRKYFIAAPQPDYKKAKQLILLLRKAQPKNGALVRLSEQIDILAKTATGNTLPSFNAYGLNGENINNSMFTSAPCVVISVWASWSFVSMDIQRQLKNRLRSAHGKLKVASICVDASKKECRETMKRDSINWPTICDEQLLEGKTIRTLGFYYVPDNIVLKKGKIVARNLSSDDLQKKLDELLR